MDTKGKFVRSKTTITKMCEVLLTELHSFTKTMTVQIPVTPDKSHSPTPRDEVTSTQPAWSETRHEDGSMSLMDEMHNFSFSVSTINYNI
jgi:hypothetical protein